MNRNLYHFLRTVQMTTSYTIGQFQIPEEHMQQNQFRVYDLHEGERMTRLHMALVVIALAHPINDLTAVVRVDKDNIPYIEVYNV